jgi:hypothetical protein
MSDFLTRLAQRAVGSQSGLEPVREPVFPANSPVDPGGEGFAAAPPLPAAAVALPAGDEPARPAPRDVPEGAAVPPARPSGSQRRETEAPTAEAERRSGLQQADPVTPSPPAERAGATSRLQNPNTPPAANRGQRSRPDPDPSPPKAKPLTAARVETQPPPRRSTKQAVSIPSPLSPSPRAVPPAPVQQAPTAPAPVTVRIGRVDVRANIAPAPPAPAPLKPERKPALGLAEYLDRRTGGRR